MILQESRIRPIAEIADTSARPMRYLFRHFAQRYAERVGHTLAIGRVGLQTVGDVPDMDLRSAPPMARPVLAKRSTCFSGIMSRNNFPGWE
jgi:hypothetical protein